MIETPEITQSETRPVAFIHLTIPREEIRNVMGPGITEVYATLGAQGIAPAGPWLSHHLRTPSDTFDFRICVPVNSPVEPSGRVQAGELPAARVVRTIYHGPYEGIGAAWGEFGAWIAREGIAVGPDFWECYLVGPESGLDPSEYRTEFNRPLAQG